MNDLALALHLADTADRIALGRFRASDLFVETKPDMSPVSDADRAVEEALRNELRDHRPADAVHGEEFGTEQGPRQWIIDPIDGTVSFVRGVPIWATLIGLREGDAITTGVVSAPALGRRWWAASSEAEPYASHIGDGVVPLRVSGVRELSDASFGYSDTIGWDSEALDRMLRSTWRQRGYGDFWSHMMVAEGSIDVAAEPLLRIHDVAALVPIVQAAGGRMTTYSGMGLTWDEDSIFSVVTTNGHLHDHVVQCLADH